MMTPLFSQHSSNPLEVSSSDVHNARRLRMLQACGGVGSSDDDYTLTHSGEGTASGWDAKTLNGKGTLQKQPVPLMVDLDEDMSDEDTLACEPGMGTAEEEEETQVDEQVDDEDEEERTILLKPPDEQEQIAEEISDLEEAVPHLREDYKIVDRLGTGTFSSVYKAIDLWYHTKWYNSPWHNRHPSNSSAHYQSEPRPKGSKAFVAIKRIYVTSGPDRIRNEISIMDDCRGCRHVSQLVTVFRHYDQIVVVMPYHKNDDFRDYYRDLPLEGIKSYLRCLFRALRDVHSRGVIHRDIKPANFLFDPRTGIGTLCDFGLACRMVEGGQKLGACLHTCALPEHPHGRIFTSAEYNRQAVRKAQKDAREKSRLATEKVGYPEKDTRPHSKANRAGTRGFRAPEVLFKCGLQSGAIDMWSSGIIFLFFLTRKFPLFQSNDDVEALMELSAIIGRKGMERTATLHSRTFSTNVPSIPAEGMTWSQFVEKLNPNLVVPRKESPHFYPHCKYGETTLVEPPLSSSPFSSHSSLMIEPVNKGSYRTRERSSSPIVANEETHKAEMALALDLLEKMLNPDATRRIQPRNALSHPFLSEEAEGICDDDTFPHAFGGGVCGDLHYYDDDTGDACVQLPQGDGSIRVKRVLSGEGLAIGNSPCEFHSHLDFPC